jgi:hypothetical protein
MLSIGRSAGLQALRYFVGYKLIVELAAANDLRIDRRVPAVRLDAIAIHELYR